MEPDWNSPEGRLPSNGDKVFIMDSAGTVSKATYRSGMWFLESGMYIYYTPTFWKGR